MKKIDGAPGTIRTSDPQIRSLIGPPSLVSSCAHRERPAIGDALAAAKPGVALKDMIDHFEGKRFGRAEPLLLPVGARCNR